MPVEVAAPAPLVRTYLTPSQVGRACQMSRRAAKNMLRATGLLELMGSRWYVDEARLRERLPDVHDRVRAARASGTP